MRESFRSDSAQDNTLYKWSNTGLPGRCRVLARTAVGWTRKTIEAKRSIVYHERRSVQEQYL